MDLSTLPATLAEFLTFLGTAGCIGAVLSFVAGNVKAFQGLSSQGKVFVLFLISLALGFLSHFAVSYIPAGVVADAEPYYKIVIQSFAILLAAKAYHSVVGEPADATKKAEAVKGVG